MWQRKKKNYDLITAIIICLGHSGDDKYTGVLKLLEKNMYEKGFSLEQIALAADKSIKEVKAIIEGKESVLV